MAPFFGHELSAAEHFEREGMNGSATLQRPPTDLLQSLCGIKALVKSTDPLEPTALAEQATGLNPVRIAGRMVMAAKAPGELGEIHPGSIEGTHGQRQQGQSRNVCHQGPHHISSSIG